MRGLTGQLFKEATTDICVVSSLHRLGVQADIQHAPGSSSNANHTHSRCGDMNTASSQVSLNEHVLLLLFLACCHFAEYSLRLLIGFGKSSGVSGFSWFEVRDTPFVRAWSDQLSLMGPPGVPRAPGHSFSQPLSSVACLLPWWESRHSEVQGHGYPSNNPWG